MGILDFLKPKPKLPPEITDLLKKIGVLAFPKGKDQIDEESKQIAAILKGKLPLAASRELLMYTKALLVFPGDHDKSASIITKKIITKSNGKLTEEEALLVYNYILQKIEPAFAGGDGSSEQSAVVINATSHITGVMQEYLYLSQICGKRDQDYTISRQSLHERDAKRYDVMSVKLKDGTDREFWFDITSFFGKV